MLEGWQTVQYAPGAIAESEQFMDGYEERKNTANGRFADH
jgi:hypothetical protein